MDREPTNSYLPAWYVTHHLQTRLLSNGMLEASIEQASVVVTPLRMVRMVPSVVNFSGGTMVDSMDNLNSTLDSRDDLINTQVVVVSK